MRHAFLIACAAMSGGSDAKIGVALASEPKTDHVAEAFAAADADEDRMLSLDEFLDRPGEELVHRRDFRLFDFDRNGGLTVGEFAAIPGVAPPSDRGSIPDPFDHLVDAALAAMDESFQQMGLKVAEGIPEQVFARIVLGSLSPDGHQRFESRWIEQSDPGQDGKVSPVEARRFIEMHLGVRGTGGDPLRDSSGRVLMIERFLRHDANANDVIERDELRDQQLLGADRNGDGEVTMAEFSHPQGLNWFDAVEWFRESDTSLDGFLSVREAETEARPEQRTLVPLTFRAFDADEDGRLSLDEYRLSMLGNPVARWQELPQDENDDYILSFDEFRFGAAPIELLRLYYFHKLDANGDRKLSHSEFPFRTQPIRRFHLIAADGSEMRLLYANPEYPHCGSPAVSPDGRTIAFDGRHGGQSLQQQRILMISNDGTGFRDVCEGLMPTWSPDGQKFACSRYRPQSGIWIVDADGTNARRLTDGWAAQWSPDGRTIAFTRDNGVWAYDVETGAIREVLAASRHPYRTIYWNMCWSPDSERLVFKARTDHGADLVSLRMTGDDRDLRVHYSGDGSIEPDTAWSPDGRRIIFSTEAPDSTHRLLYELDPTRDAPPVPVNGIDPSLTYKTSCFTPDGKWIIAATMDLEGQPRNAAIDQ